MCMSFVDPCIYRFRAAGGGGGTCTVAGDRAI